MEKYPLPVERSPSEVGFQQRVRKLQIVQRVALQLQERQVQGRFQLRVQLGLRVLAVVGLTRKGNLDQAQGQAQLWQVQVRVRVRVRFGVVFGLASGSGLA